MVLFQFTHPGKGATPKGKQGIQFTAVSIHAPWEGCDTHQETSNAREKVSIHAPWEGCDSWACRRQARSLLFQFTHPGKGATHTKESRRVIEDVSIHAPWEGCDFTAEDLRVHPREVSIHAPWEGCDSAVVTTSEISI